jgi:hypothetical protein
MELIELLGKLKEKENFLCGGGSPYEVIDRYESKLEVTFPQQYREFLHSISYARWFGVSLFGISDDQDIDVLNRTISARCRKTPAHFKPFPIHAIVLRQYGGGGFYVIFCSPSVRAGEVALFVDEQAFDQVDRWQSLEHYLQSLV